MEENKVSVPDNYRLFKQVLYNSCYGGFGFSDWANTKIKKYEEKNGPIEDERTHPFIIKLFKQNGSKKMSGKYASLKLKEFYIDKNTENMIPTDEWFSYGIDEYDGLETCHMSYLEPEIGYIKKLVHDENMTSDEKVKQIQKIFSLEAPNHIEKNFMP